MAKKEENHFKLGRLLVVPTPLGNLQDITLRALHILSQVPILATEDTRTAQRLLEAHQLWPLGPNRKLLSYFQGNEHERAQELLALLEQGLDVALLSEAGTPGISDPGHILIQAAIQKHIEIDVLPGANAVIPSLVASGFSPASFLFLGFPPKQEEKRFSLFASIRLQKSAVIFFEAPSRILRTLEELAQIIGNYRIAFIARELTKIHQQFLRGSLTELQEHFMKNEPRGEITLVLKGYESQDPTQFSNEAFQKEDIQLEEEIQKRLTQGQTPKEIAAFLSLLSGKPKRQIYQAALLYQNQKDPSIQNRK